MKSKIEGLKPQGGGIYEDDKGRTYVGDAKKGILYAVDRNSKNKLSFYQQRLSIPLIVLVMAGFYINWYVAIPAAALVYGVFEFLYRRFLSTLTVYEGVDVPKNPVLRERLEAHDTRKLAFITFLSILLGVLLIVNLFQTVGDFHEAWNDPSKAILIVVTVALDIYALYFSGSAITVLMNRIRK